MAYANTFQRMEIKYLLTSQQTEAVLQKISGFMIEDEYSRQTICSLYCDSPDDILARISLDKPVYKEKLRLRAYGTPSSLQAPCFHGLCAGYAIPDGRHTAGIRRLRSTAGHG